MLMVDPRPESARAYRVNGMWGYVDPIGVAPGAELRVHASLDAAGSIAIVGLGREAILRLRDQPGREDRQDHVDLARFDLAEAQPQVTMPGSYVLVGGPPVVADALTIGAWVRPWALPSRGTGQWAFAGIVTDLDYPSVCRFGLLIDQRGRVLAYAGDGGLFRHDRMLAVEAGLGTRLGKWLHLACSFGPDGTRVFVDGEVAASDPSLTAPATARPGPAARLRIGALAEGGLADGHLDADVSEPFVTSGVLGEAEARALVTARGRRPLSEILSAPLLAAWPLDEEGDDAVADASGHGRHGTIVNGGTWQVGGPAFDASVDVPRHDPVRDPDRGHGLRLCSDDLLDCRWPVLATYRVPEDAESGFGAVLVNLVGRAPEDALAIPFVVVRTTPRVRGAVALVVPTNTWHAYGRRYEDVAPPEGLHSSFYTVHRNGRPFFEIGTRLPIPRADPYAADSARAGRQGHAQLVRPERIAEAWLRREGYAVECVTDLELHRGELDLDAFGCLLLVGHSEYWSDEMRDQVEGYLARGGRLLSLSGDTASQRVVISRSGSAIEARKISDSDPRWLTPAWRGERWHPNGQGPGGRYRSLSRPPWMMVGVSTKGLIDDGTPTAYAPLTVREPRHRLFDAPEAVPVAADGTIGRESVNGPGLSGYEFDASPDVMGLLPEPLPGLTVLASAVDQLNLEWIGKRADQGADATWWERPDGGRVCAIASIGASGTLVDEGVGTLVRNVLHEFGVARHGKRGPA